MKDGLSKFRFYSMGVVSVDKPDNTFDIDVYPVEQLPLVEGNLKDWTKQYNYTSTDTNGVKTDISLKGEATLTASWRPLGISNRATAPDVCAGETVMLFKFADVEDIFWTTISFEPTLRKQETVCYMFSNQKQPLQSFDKDSSYWFQVDTKNKLIQLHTAANDNEICEYDIILNTGNGTLIIQDSLGNYFTLYSQDGKLVGNINKEINMTAPTTNWTGNFKLIGNLEVTETSKLDGAVTAGNTLDVKDVTTLEKDVNSQANFNLSGNLLVNGSITGA